MADRARKLGPAEMRAGIARTARAHGNGSAGGVRGGTGRGGGDRVGRVRPGTRRTGLGYAPGRRRSLPAALVRVLAVLAVTGFGAIGLRLLTAVPGHGRTQRGALALQHLSRLVLIAMGVRVVSRGAPRSGPSLVVANHGSWLDALVLSAASPMLPVAAAAVSGWPLIGRLSERAGVLFVRGDRRELPNSVAHITAMLRRGHRVQVFPEAIVGRGGGLNSFHRAAFQAAVDAAVVISPVALDYSTSPGRLPAETAGYGDLIRSLWLIVRRGRMTVRVQWLPVIPAIAGAGHPSRFRALAARRAERAIARALGQQVADREPGGAAVRQTGCDTAAGHAAPALVLAPLPRASSPGDPDSAVPKVA